MIKHGLAAAFDLRLMLTMLGVLFAILGAACKFRDAPGGNSAEAARSLPGIGG